MKVTATLATMKKAMMISDDDNDVDVDNNKNNDDDDHVKIFIAI